MSNDKFGGRKIKRERLHDNKEPIKRKLKRERLNDKPVESEKIPDLAPPRRKRHPARKPRGSNKARLITDNRQLITRRELAEICGVSVDTIKKWEKKADGDGITPVHLTRNGRSVFYGIADCERYLEINVRPKR